MCPTQVASSHCEYLAARFVIDLVDRLGAEHGFDPAELINPRTQAPFGPVIEDLRGAIREYEASVLGDDPTSQ
jgi:hypothetical protein